MPLSAGDKLGPYEILAPIGAGGMGKVYRAKDPRLNRDVAIKVSASQFSERFEREAKAIAALNHPNICQIYDVGPNYLVMEFIEGTALHGPLPLDRALRYAVQICDALDAAHKKGITHRDLKPANILVTANGVKLLDFGLAKMGSAGASPASDDPTQAVGLTEVGTVLGTASYMSPEQAKGEATDARSDIFSFGVVLYEMLSGRRAFSRNSSVETMAAIVRDEPTPLDAPASFSSIVTRCLRKSPASRFQAMNEVRAALEQSSAAPTAKTPSIAVLPFANMSADKENEYFSDGLAEEILNLLAKIPGLKVIARTSAFAFKGKEQDIRKIAETLNVGTILEGSVRRAGNRIRVTAQLIEAENGSHLWSERYDRDMTDVFAIQDDIAQAISDALKIRLAPRAQTVNIEAYQNYLKGQYYRARLTPESLAKAKEFYEQALAIDPNYAPAYSGLALYYYAQGVLSIKRPADIVSLAKSAAEKALAIDPAIGLAHIVLANIAGTFDYDWKVAEKHCRQALAAEPVPPRVRFGYVMHYLLPWGRVADAMEQCRLGLETDPLSIIDHYGMAWSIYYAKQYREAIECARRALEIDPNFYVLWSTMGLVQLHAGFTQEAIASLIRAVELAPWWHMGVGSLAAAYHQAGEHERSREWARKLAESQGQSVGAALYYAAAGEVEAMFEALDGAYRQRDAFLLYIRNLPFFDRYRADPRYQALLQKMNLAWAHK
jgi:serine/threonine protein kinase/Tfp pilus assembly protein PilF